MHLIGYLLRRQRRDTLRLTLRENNTDTLALRLSRLVFELVE